MGRFMFCFLLLVGCVFSAENWNGWRDTSAVIDTLEADTIKYSKAFSLTDGEDVRVVLLHDDTSSAGFSSDSMKVQWGYQTGCPVLDSGGSIDTIWDDFIVIDTLDDDSLGKARSVYGSVTYSGTLTREWKKRSDTLSVSGYAIQNRWFVPEWNVLIRYFVKGLTGNNAGCSNEFRFMHCQREGAKVKR